MSYIVCSILYVLYDMYSIIYVLYSMYSMINVLYSMFYNIFIVVFTARCSALLRQRQTLPLPAAPSWTRSWGQEVLVYRCPGLQVSTGLYRSIQVYTGLYRSIQVYTGLYRSSLDRVRGQ